VSPIASYEEVVGSCGVSAAAAADYDNDDEDDDDVADQWLGGSPMLAIYWGVSSAAISLRLVSNERELLTCERYLLPLSCCNCT